MKNIDVIKKLIGNVRAKGVCIKSDEESLENLKEMCLVVKELLSEIDMSLCEYPFAKNESILKNRKYAYNFLNEIGYRKDE